MKKVLVENLTKNVTEVQLKDFFKPFGEVDYANINLPHGKTTIEMDTEAKAKEFVAAFNGKEFNGQIVKVTLVA